MLRRSNSVVPKRSTQVTILGKISTRIKGDAASLRASPVSVMQRRSRCIELEYAHQVGVARNVSVRIKRRGDIAAPALYLSVNADQFDIGNTLLLANAVDHNLAVNQESALGRT